MGRLRTLYAKQAAVFLVLFALFGALYLVWMVFTARNYFEEAYQKLNRGLAADLVAGKSFITRGAIDENAFHELMVINPSLECYLLDSNGRVLRFFAEPSQIKRRTVSLGPVRRFLEGPDALPIRGDDPRSNKQKTFSVAALPEGYLYIILAGQKMDSVRDMLRGSYAIKFSVWTAAAALLFMVLAGLLVSRVLTRRLRTLTVAVDGFQRSGFSGGALVFPGRPDGDEIDRLGLAFNAMAARLIDQMEAVKGADALRRELVANISHDLRTPLANLQGYLETILLKQEALTAEERRSYVETAARHSQRLSQLVSELFELATLDAPEAALRVEPFHVGELAQDVVQKLRALAEQRRMRLETGIPADLPFVEGDIRLIERVFENLIDNACRHTAPGCVVRVVLRAEPDGVRAEVSDTGRGIPPESLPHIFDRHYRVPHEGGDHDGGGLGLAIVRRILDLHDTRIDVESTVGVGTTFRFRLYVPRPGRSSYTQP
jgi:signal transduction histidine kinase